MIEMNDVDVIEARTDPTTGRVYFFNTATLDTSWTDPRPNADDLETGATKDEHRPGRHKNRVHRALHTLRQLTNPSHQSKSPSETKQQATDCFDAASKTTTFLPTSLHGVSFCNQLLPHHIFTHIVAFVGECIPVKVMGYRSTPAFIEHWDSVNLSRSIAYSLNYAGGGEQAVSNLFQHAINIIHRTLPTETSLIPHYNKDQALFHHADVKWEEYLPTSYLQNAYSLHSVQVQQIPHLQMQLKYFLAHFYRTRATGLGTGLDTKAVEVYKMAYHKITNGLQIQNQSALAVTTRKVVNAEMNNSQVFKYPPQQIKFCHAIRTNICDVLHSQQPIVFVRDIQTLSSISCASKQCHAFMLSSTVWGQRQQENLHRFYQGQATAIDQMKPKIAVLRGKVKVVAAASELSNQFSMHEQSVCCFETLLSYGFPCFLFILCWMGVASLVEAKGRTTSSDLFFNNTNHTNHTNHTNSGTVRNADVFISQWSDPYSFDLVYATLIGASVLSCCVLALIPLFWCPRCRCRKMFKYCFTMGCSKTCQAIKFASTSMGAVYFFVYGAIALAVVVVVLLPGLMLLLRTILWGQLSQAEQMEAIVGGKPVEIYFFPVWPFFLPLCLCVAAVLVYCSEMFLDLTGESNEKRLSGIGKCGVGMIFLLGAFGLCGFIMKFDHAVFMENISGLQCAIVIMIAVGVCCCRGVWVVVNVRGGPDICCCDSFITNWLVAMCCLLAVPSTFITLWVYSVDEQLDVGVWVYFIVLTSVMCCCSLMVFGTMLANFDDS